MQKVDIVIIVYKSLTTGCLNLEQAMLIHLFEDKFVVSPIPSLILIIPAGT